MLNTAENYSILSNRIARKGHIHTYIYYVIGMSLYHTATTELLAQFATVVSVSKVNKKNCLFVAIERFLSWNMDFLKQPKALAVLAILQSNSTVT